MTEFKESIINFPKEIYASIACYLEDGEGDYFRDQAGDFIIKEIRGNKTYGNGVLHSFNDIPAVIQSNGSQIWYKNGERHRDNDMPAIINSDVFNKVRSQYWYKNGSLHRDNDMPAIIRNGTQEWWRNGHTYKL